MFTKRLRKFFATFLGWWVLMALLAACIRLPYWTQVPIGLNRDEAALGYNAFSIAHTGRDEFGAFLPASITSFGDQKLPGYVYTLVPIVRLFGLSPATTKLPSLLAGFALIGLAGWVAFLVVPETFRSRTARWTMFLMAISPWANHFSRVAYEAHLAMALYVFGLGAALMALAAKDRWQRWWLVASALGFSLSVATYHSYHILVPLTLVGLALIFWRSLFSLDRPGLLGGIGIGLAVAALLFFGGVWQANQTKIAGISPYSNEILAAQIQKWHEAVPGPESLKWFVWNRPTAALSTFVTNIALVFSPASFFVPSNAHGVHNPHDISNLHLLLFPLTLAGLWWLTRIPRSRQKSVYLLWLFGAALAPALTIAPQHTIRLSPMFPALEILGALGIIALLDSAKRSQRAWLRGLLVVFLLANAAWMATQYWWIAPAATRAESHEKFELLAQNLAANQSKYDRVITTSPSDSPYIWYVFQTHYDPARFAATVRRYPADEEGFLHVAQIDNLEFRSHLDWPALEFDRVTQTTLLIAKPEEIPIDKRDADWPTKIGEVRGAAGDLYYELWKL